MSDNGSVECPFYYKVAHDDGKATQLYFIVCDEGWRTSILCSQMYVWQADWLVDQLQGKPYPSSRSSESEAKR